MNYKDSAFISASFTRLSNTTPYTANDVCSNNSVITFSNASKIAGSKLLIVSVSLRIRIASVPSGMDEFRLHLYDSSPTAINDNVTFTTDLTNHKGFIALSAPVDLGDVIMSENTNCSKIISLGEGVNSFYGILQTVDGYTPSSADIFDLTLGIIGADGV